MGEQKYDWMVCVRCYTYNHAPYITDAMNGFTMQRTDFPYVCCIIDDASTDDEQEVIKSYLNENFDFDKTGQGQLYQKQQEYGTLIFTRHKTNHNCYFAVVLLNENHNGTPELKKLKRSFISEWENSCQYEAICEGDDYWIDPLKLQKQVNFLESHLDYGMCYTNFNILKQETNKIIHDVFNSFPKKYKSSYSSPNEFILSKGYVCPPSWVFRKDCIPSSTIKSVDGSFVLFTHFLVTTKVKYLNDITSTYRILTESASHSKDLNRLYLRVKNILHTQLQLIDLYNLDSSLKNKCIEAFYTDHLGIFVANSNQDEVNKAKRMIKNRTIKHQVLIICDMLRLNRVIKYIKLLKI